MHTRSKLNRFIAVLLFLVQGAVIILSPRELKAEEVPASVSALVPASEPAAPALGWSVEPLGFAQFWYSHDWDDTKATQDSVQAQRVRPGLTAKVGDKIRFFMLTEFGNANPSASGSGSGSLLDANATYRYNDLLSVRLGQDWYRFSLEGTWTLFEMPFITRTEAVDGIWLRMGRNGAFSYDRGLFVFGKQKQFPYFGYTVSVTEGTGLDKTDDNKRKDIVGKITFQPYKGLHLGFSAFNGASRVPSKINPAFNTDLNEESYGVEYFQTFGRYFRVISEYLWADYKGDSTQGISAVRPRGWYAAVGFHPVKNFEFVVRQAEYDPNNLTNEARIFTTTIGLTYTINKFNNLRLNYQIRDAQKNYAAVAAVSDPKDLLIFQWQVFFFPPDLTKNFLKPFAD